MVAERDATELQRQIPEVNAGIYAVDSAFLWDNLGRLGSQNDQGEYYLTDTPGMLLSEGRLVDAHRTADASAALGVNDLNDLAQAETLLRQRSADNA